MSNETRKSSKSEKARVQGASSSLRGYPGYRTREGRSGLDPIDNDAEGGHMAGVLLRRLMTGNLRTRNPLTMLLWAVLGMGCALPLLLAVLEALRGNLLPLAAWGLIIPAGLFGIALLVNLGRNLLRFWGN